MSRRPFSLGLLAVLLFATDTGVAQQEPLPPATPEELGFSPVHLERATMLLNQFIAEQKIAEITEKKARAEAQAQYEQRTERKAAHDSEQSVAREGRTGKHREHAVEAHRRYVTNLGIEYLGVKDTTGQEIRPRRSRCGICGIAVDNFVGAACLACNDLLCSCGACNCGTKTRARPRAKTTLSKGDK